MSRTPQSKAEKAKVKEIVENYLGVMIQPNTRRQDWLISENQQCSLFITFAKDVLGFFDIGRDDLDVWGNYSHAFVLFVLGSHNNTFIMPISELQKHLQLENRWAVGDGTYKLHLVEQNGLKFRELPRLPLNSYRNNFALLSACGNASTADLPEEVPEFGKYPEGARQRIWINAYERNEQARQKCIEYYGAYCYVCQMEFSKVYTEVVKGLIHAHHLRQLSEVEEEYEVNPIEDLRPVCPNCHAVIHSRRPPYSVEEVNSMLAKAKHT